MNGLEKPFQTAQRRAIVFNCGDPVKVRHNERERAHACVGEQWSTTEMSVKNESAVTMSAPTQEDLERAERAGKVLNFLLENFPRGPRSQRELAAEVNLGNGTISRICNGSPGVKRGTFERIAEFYRLDMSVFEQPIPFDFAQFRSEPEGWPIASHRQQQPLQLQHGAMKPPKIAAQHPIATAATPAPVQQLELVMIPDLETAQPKPYPSTVLGGRVLRPNDQIVAWQIQGASLVPWAHPGGTVFVLIDSSGSDDGSLCLVKWKDRLRAGRVYSDGESTTVKAMNPDVPQIRTAAKDIEVIGVILSALSAAPPI